MRGYRISAAALAVLAAAGCGSDNGPSNPAPVAKFSISCTLLDCTFTDASTDDGSVDEWAWDFGETGSGSNTATAQSPSHSYAAAGAYHVTLTVKDDKGASSSVADSTVTVSDVVANQDPTADFTFSCAGLDCTFSDASSDADGTIASYSWNFGETGSVTNTSTAQNPTHTYVFASPTTAQVTLTVTDDDGATDQITKSVAVTPPGGLTCDNGSGTFVGCTLDLTSKSTVTITLSAEDCNATGNTLSITSPITETVFTDACHTPVPGTPGATVAINGGNSFNAGTSLSAQMTSGSTDPNRIPPAVHVTGTFPDWTLSFDDGEDPTGPGEPDFNDLTVTVHATIVP